MRYTRLLIGALIATIGVACCSVDPAPAESPDHGQLATQDTPNPLLHAIGVLNEHCPLNASIKVEFLEIDAAVWGWTWWDPIEGMYHIQVDNRQPLHSMLNTLAHEWAHAMVWDASLRAGDDAHGPLWGVAWARCYRALLNH